MKNSRHFSAMLAVAAVLTMAFMGQAMAQSETANVVSSTAIVQQVVIPQRVCTTQQVAVQSQKSGAGAVMGAIAGGAMGNAMGGGNGKTVATMFGLFGGAVLGNNIEGPGQVSMQDVQACNTAYLNESRVVGFNVVYEYAGKQYSTRMPNDPGSFIRVSVTPIGAQTSAFAFN
jgi:uncharacterized protein YcfJ